MAVRDTPAALWLALVLAVVPWGAIESARRLPLWLAVALATLSFGLSHGYKSLVGMLRLSLVGLVLAVPVLVTGTLLPSIIAHAVMDLLAGANTLVLARRLGVAILEPGPAPLVAVGSNAPPSDA